MRCISGIFCFVVVLTIGGAVQELKKPKPDDTDVRVAELTVTFGGHASGVNALAFSLDGRQVVSAGAQNVRTWDRATGKESGVVKRLGGEVVALRPDGKSIAIAGRQNVSVHDASNGKELLSVEPHGDWDRTFSFRPAIAAVAFCPDGGRFVTAGSVAKVGGPHGLPGGVVTIWDAKTGQALHRFDKLNRPKRISR